MAHPSHVLVIRLSAMGDVAMTVPVIHQLVKNYPDVRVTVLTRKFFEPLFQDLSNVTVFEVDVKGRHKGVTGLYRLAKELKETGIDAVADLHHVLRSQILKFFFMFSGIPFCQVDKGRKDKRALTRIKNKIFKPLISTHQRYAHVFRCLGFVIDLTAWEYLPKHQVSEGIKDLAGADNLKRIGIAPFAQHTAKAYPVDLMREVIAQLTEQNGIKIFFFGGGPWEIEVLSTWEREFPHCVNLAGKLSFREELNLISNLDIMVSMDSGNGHLAANFGVPVLTLWGSTHPYAGFAPYGQPATNFLLPDLGKYPQIPTSVYGNKMPEGYENAMRTIPVQRVVEKIKEILKMRS